jgi:hypothetical protein
VISLTEQIENATGINILSGLGARGSSGEVVEAEATDEE